MRCAVLVVLALGGVARAQPSDTKALAEQLFNQARDLAKADHWAEACPKFEASLRYDPALGTRLNLASCYEHVGKIASAWGMYRDSVEVAEKAGDVKRRDFAKKQATALEPRLPKLTIVAPLHAPPQLVVERDGTTIDSGAFGVALYVDPGAHHIVARAPGFDPVEHDVTVAEKGTESYAIPDLTASPIKPPPDKKEPDVKPPIVVEAPPQSPRRMIGLITGIGGVALVGVGLGFGAAASSKNGDVKTLCGADRVCSPDNYAKGQQLVKDAKFSATMSTILVAAGGVAIATGVVLWVTAPKHASDTAVGLVPIVAPDQAGLAAMGHF